MLDSHCSITFDTDWAPDWCIRLCYDLCKAAGCVATFFVTNSSPSLEVIADDPDFELGIHPNFHSGSSQGNDICTIVQTCLDALPKKYTPRSGSIPFRTHDLFQSSRMLREIVVNFPMINNDVSLFLPGCNNVTPFPMRLTQDDTILWRMPYVWEDDVASFDVDWNWSVQDVSMSTNGVDIFDFHPIHVALNMKTMMHYENLKKACTICDATEENVDTYANNHARGTRTFLEDLLASMQKKPLTIGSIATLSRHSYESRRNR